jgi:aspartate/methionine/tyrosine aminotransferase
LVLADEVYETLVYTDSVAPMIKFASLPDMFDMTITVGSMGKAFGVTGWKIGWVLASKELVRSCWLVHQFLPFSVVTPLQEAGADALEQACENGYFEETVGIYQKLRDQLYEALDKNGFKPCKPDGGYFIVSDIQKFGVKEDFSTYLTKEVGVTSIPMRAFYDRESHQDVEHLVRFAFCKDKSTLDKGIERLQKIKSAQ